MIVFVYFLLNSLGISSQPGRLILPEQVKVSEERFDKILSAVTKAKIDGLKTNADGREITLDNAESLLKDLGSGKVDKHGFAKKYIIADGVKTKSKLLLTRSQNKMVKILLPIEEIVYGPREKLDTTDTSEESEESDKQPNTTDMPELQSQESAAERRTIDGMKLDNYCVLCTVQKN